MHAAMVEIVRVMSPSLAAPISFFNSDMDESVGAASLQVRGGAILPEEVRLKRGPYAA